jgi:hypothetical protein
VTQKPGDPNNPGKGLDPDQFYLDSEWESWEDANGNGIYDPPEPLINLFPDTAIYGDNYTGPAYTWGEAGLRDLNLQSGLELPLSDFVFNNNGVRDNQEGEPFIDLNGNGLWDQGEYLHDKNGNGVLDMDRMPNIEPSRISTVI